MAQQKPQGRAVSRDRRRTLVLTTCSSSKRFKFEVRAEALPFAAQKEVAETWASLISKARPVGTSTEVYRGRALALAIRAAGAIGADLGIVSAGLGYVTEQSRIPSYDLTLQGKSRASIRTRLSGAFDHADWWKTVVQGAFATDFGADAVDRPMILACLSRPYAEMFGCELLEAVRDVEKVRVFGLNVAVALPARLRPAALPYDERLSSVGMKGTRVDFGQRALLHYVESILAARLSLMEERRRIESILSGISIPARPVRTRLSDDAIKIRIRVLMERFGLRRTRILAHLRSVEKISCEQARFGSLFMSIEKELAR